MYMYKSVALSAIIYAGIRCPSSSVSKYRVTLVLVQDYQLMIMDTIIIPSYQAISTSPKSQNRC